MDDVLRSGSAAASAEITSKTKDALDMLRRGETLQAYEVLRAVEAQVLRPGLADAETAKSVVFSALGTYFKRVSKFSVAVSYFQRTLELQLQVRTEEMALAGTHLNLCSVYSKLERHEEALEAALSALDLTGRHITALETSASSSGASKEDYTTLAIAYHNVAVEREAMRQWGEAAMAYKQGHEVAHRCLGPKHPLTLQLRSNCETCLVGPPRQAIPAAQIVPDRPRTEYEKFVLPTIPSATPKLIPQWSDYTIPGDFPQWPPATATKEERKWYKFAEMELAAERARLFESQDDHWLYVADTKPPAPVEFPPANIGVRHDQQEVSRRGDEADSDDAGIDQQNFREGLQSPLEPDHSNGRGDADEGSRGHDHFRDEVNDGGNAMEPDDGLSEASVSQASHIEKASVKSRDSERASERIPPSTSHHSTHSNSKHSGGKSARSVPSQGRSPDRAGRVDDAGDDGTQDGPNNTWEVDAPGNEELLVNYWDPSVGQSAPIPRQQLAVPAPDPMPPSIPASAKTRVDPPLSLSAKAQQRAAQNAAIRIARMKERQQMLEQGVDPNANAPAAMVKTAHGTKYRIDSTSNSELAAAIRMPPPRDGSHLSTPRSRRPRPASAHRVAWHKGFLSLFCGRQPHQAPHLGRRRRRHRRSWSLAQRTKFRMYKGKYVIVIQKHLRGHLSRQRVKRLRSSQ
mmetsp:Transcript_88705/g.237234  ORF Transcript_88705/g.237234 Transcript_88705/m.237234 type:complete len:687 (-) Transcript_88705:167-2227(-)